MKKLISIVLLLAFMLIMCGMFSCKTRKVSLSKVDSNTTTKTEAQVHKQASSLDTGKISTVTKTDRSDSSSYEVKVEVTPGDTIVIKNGEYRGPAKSVTIKGKTHTQAKTDETKLEQKGVSTQASTDSSAKGETKTQTSKKIKETQTKRDYSWILYVAGALLVLIGVVILYIKLIKKTNFYGN